MLSQRLFIASLILFSFSFIFPVLFFFSFFVLLIPVGQQLSALRKKSSLFFLDDFESDILIHSTSRPELTQSNNAKSARIVEGKHAYPSSELNENNLDSGMKNDDKFASKWGIPTLRIKDFAGNIILVNSENPVPLESDYFKGVILFMVRTEGDHAKYNRYENHFRGRQRKFEVQIQVDVKIYMG